MATLERKEGPWGVELCYHLGMDSMRAILSKRPTGGVKTEISFSGVPPGQAMTLVEAQAWSEAFNSLLTETRKTVLDMKT